MLRRVAGEFGWSVGAARDLNQIAETHNQPVAVFLQREVFGPGVSWPEAIRLFGHILPGARLVACHGFAEAIDWRGLSELGAFHTVGIPFRENEVRQSLGFIWEAEKRRTQTLESLPAIAQGARLNSIKPNPPHRTRAMRTAS